MHSPINLKRLGQLIKGKRSVCAGRSGISCPPASRFRPWLEILEERQLLSPWIVTSTADDGSAGTLRWAINQSNAEQTLQSVIHFDPSILGQTISLERALPVITHSVEIQAPVGNSITLDGSNLPDMIDGVPVHRDGLVLDADNCFINGLVIQKFDSGIAIFGGSGDQIGIDGWGNLISHNRQGVLEDAVDNNAIVGNVIIHNEFGIDLTATASQNKIEGNLIGLTSVGSFDGNTFGIRIEGAAHDNQIGSTDPGEGNIISGNGDGIDITGSDTDHNIVESNVIGTTGSDKSLGNKRGVAIEFGARDNRIGTPDDNGLPYSNLIAGNNTGVYIGDFNGNELDGGATSYNRVQRNSIGTYPAWGSAALGNDVGVILEASASNNTIGGPIDPGESGPSTNVIWGNGEAGVAIVNDAEDNQIGGDFKLGYGNVISDTNFGVGVAITDSCANNTVEGNVIGADPFQPNWVAAPNDQGVSINTLAINNTIGGVGSGAGNFILGNTNAGITIHDPGATGNKIQGNSIGVSPYGPLPNGTGVSLSAGASGNIIGGTEAGAGNVISGNNNDGINIDTSLKDVLSGSEVASNNVVEMNIIGADGSGQNAQPNGGAGVRISGASFNTIGMPNAGNTIAFNRGAGVDVVDSSDGLPSNSNAIRGNSIFDNAALGIDLGGDGVTANDDKDPDTGPNNLQNYPSLTYQGPNTVSFTLNSTPGSTFTIDFYANKVPDPSGHGQGRDWLGSKTVTTDGAGNTPPDTFTYTPIIGEPFITATATLMVNGMPTDTSEFSGDEAPLPLHVLNRNLLIDLNDGQFFRMARDPLFPQFLDLSFDKDTLSIDPSVFTQINVTGAADSTIDIEDVPAGLPVAITGVTGNQIVNISPSAQNLVHIQSPVSVHGGKSSLTLNIYDHGDPLADVYTLTDSGFSDKQSAGISYDGVSAVNLIGSGLPSTYNILNTASSATTALYSNNGGDVINVEATTGPLTVNLPASGNPTVHVSPTAQDLSTIQGNLTVTGQGFGTLAVHDEAGKAARKYALRSTSFDWGSPASITFSKLGALAFDATAFNDFVTVQSLPLDPVILNGGEGDNTLIGPDIDNVWSMTKTGVVGTLDDSLVFNAFASVIGGQVKDRFVIPNGAYIPEFLSGGDGATGGNNNTLDLSAWTSPLTVHTGTSVYGGTVPGVVRAFALCQNVIGGQSDDRFLIDQGYGFTTVDGGPGNNTLDLSPYVRGTLVVGIHGHDSGLVAGIVSAFSNIQNLIGGQTDDQFAFRGTAYLDGTIDGQGGTNLLSYIQSAASVSVNLQTGTASYVNLQGGSVPQPGGIANMQSFIGGPGSANTLIAADTPNSWSITGPNSGTVHAFTFQGFQYLTGGAAADTFAFQQGGSISGSIDGGGGVNALDYSQYTGDITVVLGLNLASLVNQGSAGSVLHIANVAGSIGNDLLVGDANDNRLTGGYGRNILIGGAGSDKLDASRAMSDNILLGGRTDYDTSLAALDAIFAEWTRTDLGFRDRFSDLLTGSNSTGAPALNEVGGQLILLTPATNPKSNNGTVHADTSPDTLIGTSQTDPATGRRAHNWFFDDADDTLVNFLSSSDQRRKVT